MKKKKIEKKKSKKKKSEKLKKLTLKLSKVEKMGLFVPKKSHFSTSRKF